MINHLQFIPKNFIKLADNKKVIFNDINLKTDYIINIMNDLIIKYFYSNNFNTVINLSSLILKQKYGKQYNHYIDYLIQNGFMFKTSKYFVGKKCNTYKLNVLEYKDIKRVRISDNILIKKLASKIESITDSTESSIDIKIRQKLISDLEYITLDVDKSIEYLNKQNMDHYKYNSNMISIDNIKYKYKFIKFDGYGRFHTNFTNLKRHIRKEYIKIDGLYNLEMDIPNSQPMFLSILMKEILKPEEINEEISNFLNLVIDGLIYAHFEKIYPEIYKKRCDAKIMIYKVLFGENKEFEKENKIFKKEFPSVFSFIKRYKDKNGFYQSLAHKLQRLESDFIFGEVVKDVYDNIPNIHIFTIHDSICFPYTYKNQVELIFNKHLDILKKKII